MESFKHKISALLIVALLLISFISHKLVQYFLSNSSNFNIQHVQLKGMVLGIDEQLEKIIQTSTNEQINLDKFDIHQLQTNLEQHILIRSAKITKFFPDTLQIDISERLPIAQVKSPNHIYVVAQDAMILPLQADSNDLPISVEFGIAIDDKTIVDDYLAETIHALNPQLTKNIASINIDRNRETMFTMKNFNIPFTISNKIINQNHIEKAEKIVTYYQQNTNTKKPKLIDVYSDPTQAIGIK